MAEVFTTAGNCLIFKNGGTPFATNCFTGKIRRIEWSRNGTPIRSYVPLCIGSVGYLFDRVSGQLFGNAGTGDFVLGPDTFASGVVPTRMCVMGVRAKEVLVEKFAGG